MKTLNFEKMERIHAGSGWGCVGGVLGMASSFVGVIASAPTIAGSFAFMVGFQASAVGAAVSCGAWLSGSGGGYDAGYSGPR